MKLDHTGSYWIIGSIRIVMILQLENFPSLRYMCKSQIEIEYYSVAYFECITKFDAL